MRASTPCFALATLAVMLSAPGAEAPPVAEPAGETPSALPENITLTLAGQWGTDQTFSMILTGAGPTFTAQTILPGAPISGAPSLVSFVRVEVSPEDGRYRVRCQFSGRLSVPVSISTPSRGPTTYTWQNSEIGFVADALLALGQSQTLAEANGHKVTLTLARAAAGGTAPPPPSVGPNYVLRVRGSFKELSTPIEQSLCVGSREVYLAWTFLNTTPDPGVPQDAGTRMLVLQGAPTLKSGVLEGEIAVRLRAPVLVASARGAGSMRYTDLGTPVRLALSVGASQTVEAAPGATLTFTLEKAPPDPAPRGGRGPRTDTD